ncbi:MAG TPA: hypothetical protein RMF84_08810 [Polyangiaceae bacterium LLY-WYZ-14_1]|nr:hypothetical protein [Polyangiaceae bacterium LLY-WYZ-14_1]
MRWWKLTWLAAAALPVVLAAGCGDDGIEEVPFVPPSLPDAGDSGIPRSIDRCDPDFAPTSCENDGDCDNFCFCDGLERCEGGTCVAGEVDPCADEIECTEDVCLEELDRCFRQPLNDVCSNGEACDGFEVCNPAEGCQQGVDLFCNDENSCTVDTCNDAVGCVFTRRDLDGDGFLDGGCGGEDCNDDPREGREIFPGAPENCTNRLDDNCDGIRDFNQDTCVPGNDTCDEARILPGPGLYSASTKLLTGDYELSCGDPGVDAVFQFTVPSGWDPDAEVDAVDVGFQALGVPVGAVVLRDSASCDAGPESDLRCTPGEAPSFLARSLAPGDYTVIVRTLTPVTSFDVRLTFDSPTPIPNYDLCNAETDVISESGSYSGRFEETTHQYEPTCGFGTEDEPRVDGAYRLVLDSPKDVRLSLFTEPTSLNQAVLTVYDGACGSQANEGVCVTGSTTEWSRQGLPAGEYFIVIESQSPDATSWELDVDLEDAEERLPGDACETAIDISDGTPRTAVWEDFALDLTPSCATFNNRDAVFSFTLTDTSDVTIQSQVASTVGWDTTHTITLVSPWEGCGLIANERSCVRTSSPNIRQRSLPPGTYYVLASTSSTRQLSVTVSAEIGPPTPIPENDRCDGVVPEVCAGGSSFIDPAATWVDFNDDYRGTCYSSFLSPIDAVFKCTLDEASIVSVSVDAPTASTAYVWFGEGETCPGSPDDSLCSGDFRRASLAGTLEAGTYWIVTENRIAADYSLTVVNVPRP